ncbi:dihydrolipoyl dehydrogenase [Rhodanobacter lindaniclasticus]
MDSREDDFDVVVVGGGPGGYVAAIRAAQLGLRTALVEKDKLGGICLNWGCIPTKALLRSADVLRLVRNASTFGVNADVRQVDVAAMVARSRAVAERLNAGVTGLLKKHGVRVPSGHARLAGGGELQIEPPDGATRGLRAKHIILATGARPRALSMLPADGQTVWTYREALLPPRLPASLIVVGGGAIGIEFASFYRAVGVDVTVVEMAERILPLEDAEVSGHVAASLGKDGIAIHAGAAVKSASRRDGQWHVVLEGGDRRELQAEVVLVAAGIVGNVEALGLEHTAVKVERSHIVTGAHGETAEAGVYAIGDVAGPPWLAHKASHEGVLCVEHLAGHATHPLDPLRVPACTYSHPQVASVGLTEAKARAAGHRVRVGKFPFAANGKAIAMGATGGFAKVVFDEANGELLGAHMVGEDVAEMIQGFVVAQTLEATEADLMAAIFPHPTMSESMHEAVLDAWGRSLHL